VPSNQKKSHICTMISLTCNLSRLISLFCLLFSINLHGGAVFEQRCSTYIPVSCAVSSAPSIFVSPTLHVFSEQLSCSTRIKLERKRRKTIEVTSALFNLQSYLFNPFLSNLDPFPIKQGSPHTIQSDYLIRGPPSLS
jgi:hypothetical protein